MLSNTVTAFALIAGTSLVAAGTNKNATRTATVTLRDGSGWYDMYTPNFTETDLCGPKLEVELADAGPSGYNWTFVYAQFTFKEQTKDAVPYAQAVCVPDNKGGRYYRVDLNPAATGLFISTPDKTTMGDEDDWLWAISFTTLHNYTCA